MRYRMEVSEHFFYLKKCLQQNKKKHRKNNTFIVALRSKNSKNLIINI